MSKQSPKRRADFEFLTSRAETDAQVAGTQESQGEADSDRTVDGVVLSNNDSGAACVKCPGSLEVGYVQACKIAACRDCHGLLVEARLLAQIISMGRANYVGDEVAATPLDPDELRQAVECVVCAQEMDTHAYCGPGSVVIDSCHSCGLIWLDGRELKRIIEAPGQRELLAKDLVEFDSTNPLAGIQHTGTDPTLFDNSVASAIAWMLM